MSEISDRYEIYEDLGDDQAEYRLYDNDTGHTTYIGTVTHDEHGYAGMFAASQMIKRLADALEIRVDNE